MKRTILSLLIVAGIFTSCKKDPDDPQPAATPAATLGSLAIEFENMVGDSDLVLNTKEYLNANGDTFTVSKFNYYISNIKLTGPNGLLYAEAESYHLVQESVPGSKTFTLTNVPFGTYTAITFIIGVDSARNVSGAQTGALDPANGMFWNWSTGYIMAKVEGTSPQSTATNHALMFHSGGFKGANSVLKTVSPFFNTSTATVSSTVVPEIHMKADLSEWFKNPISVNFATTNTVHMAGATAKQIADNYADMFSVEHIHN